MALLTFDATKINPAGDRSAVPAGQYKVILQSSDIKPGKTAADKILTLGFKILEGPCANQFIFANLNIQHSNAVAQSIAQERLSALCYAVGVLQITDSGQLHGRPLQLKISQRKEDKDDPNSKIYNEIDSWLREDGTAVTGGGAASGPSGPPPAWAPGATPAPAPAPAPAPIPPPVAPTPAPGAGKTYYVAHNGTNLTPQPVTADQVRLLPQGLANLHVLEVGTQTWQPATVLAVQAPPITAAPPAPPQAPPSTGGMPPWMTPPAA